jgi:citronellol/citronellal dehydrogenase
MSTLEGKTLFVTGASRGIGEAIALRAARDGANVVIAAKTTTPHPKLEGTIFTAAARVEAAGGRALPLAVDIRDEGRIAWAMAEAAAAFGGIDILVNNASAISLAGTAAMETKRFDLMHAVNARGTFLCGKHALPFLERSENPHVLCLSPPPTLDPRWYAPHLGYTISKFGMSLCVLGWAEEFRDRGIAANALWPRTTIATAAVQNLFGGEEMVRRSRRPEIVADAAHWILTRPSRDCTGNFFLDEDVLREGRGVTDFSAYAVDPGAEPMPDLFI